MSRTEIICWFVVVFSCWLALCLAGCPCNRDYVDISPLPDVFTSTKLPTEACCLPSVGNGYLATVVYSDAIYVNGVYNGDKGKSHRARVPSTAAIRIILPPEVHATKEWYTLYAGNGTFQRTILTADAVVEQRLYAHQNLSCLLVSEISVVRVGPARGPITLTLLNNTGPQSNDIQFMELPPGQGTRQMFGKIVTTETSTSGPIHVAVTWTDVPGHIALPTDQTSKTWTFLTAVGPDTAAASRCHARGLQLAAAGELAGQHAGAWRDKWDAGRIDVDRPDLAKAVYGSLYYILSSLPGADYQASGQTVPYHFYGLSPGGLAHGALARDYEGHVFWDQETWMYPPVLLLHPHLGRAMLGARTYQLDAAKALAQARGHQGAQYPWEMAYSGDEVCPVDTIGREEIHVNGDISLAVQQYLHMTQDRDFLARGRGYEMAAELAKFWASRVKYDEAAGQYDITGVIPPDEYHTGVKNSVYTNAVAQIGLRLPAYAAKLMNASVPSAWGKIADGLKILYDEQRDYHPEYESYTIGTQVKQADAILLGFPLGLPMGVQTRRNDLEIYEQFTDPDGPAMSWSMFSVGYGDVGNASRRDHMFLRNFDNIQAPFGVWTEQSSGDGAINFITGMGGFLQSVLFGYAGFRIHPDHLSFGFALPPGVTEFGVNGLNYRGSEIDFHAIEKTVCVTMTSHDPGAPSLELTTPSGDVVRMVQGIPIRISRAGQSTISAVSPLSDS